jgi:hypothetical protein
MDARFENVLRTRRQTAPPPTHLILGGDILLRTPALWEEVG